MIWLWSDIYRTPTKHRLQHHLVWIPKYRKRVLRGKIVSCLKRLLYDICRMNSWWISKLQKDHVHIVMQTNLWDSVAEVMQRLKGGTSRVIRKEFPELEEFLWGDSFWADGYFAETVGNVDKEVVNRYIRDQRRWLSQVMPASQKLWTLAQRVVHSNLTKKEGDSYEKAGKCEETECQRLRIQPTPRSS